MDAVGRPEHEIAEAEARIAAEREEREDRKRAAEFAKVDGAMQRAVEREEKRLAVPRIELAQAMLDDIDRVDRRNARRKAKPTPPPEPAPAPLPSSWNLLTPEQYREVAVGRRLRHLLSEARADQ
jgi:hypothetical protein